VKQECGISTYGTQQNQHTINIKQDPSLHMTSITGSLPNIYHHRHVVAGSSKPCFICYKPTTSVLITPDNRDFFYTCQGHLTDRGFAQPIGHPGEDAEAKKKREELEREIELVKKEYEEKQKKKTKKGTKDKDKQNEDEVKAGKDDDAKDEIDRDDKVRLYSVDMKKLLLTHAPTDQSPRAGRRFVYSEFRRCPADICVTQV